MISFPKLLHKQRKIAIGLISGTSADGIDAVVVEISGSGVKTRIKEIGFHTYPYKQDLKKFILKNSNNATAKLEDVVRLNILLGELFADSALNLLKNARISPSEVDFIGSHGQTIQHLPDKKEFFSKKISGTFQIADPSIIAKRTGILTFGDFRIADVAVGGSGAPLIPYFDYIVFYSDTKNRALLNIGGIANLTVLPKACSLKEVFAFDTGPGNMIIDSLMKKFFGKPFDKNGEMATDGKLISELLNWMLKHNYFSKSPPKSTGREMFGEKYIADIIKNWKRYQRKDIITTVTEFTAISIYDSYLKFIKPKVQIDELIVSGGGVHNGYLISALQQYFCNISMKPIESFGFSSDSKEAICFAILANETLSGNCANVMGAIGARCNTILGKICLP